MKCQYCRKEIPEQSVYCPECGKKQQSRQKMQSRGHRDAILCPECGTPVKAGDLFCEECGCSLSEILPGNQEAYEEEEQFQIPGEELVREQGLKSEMRPQTTSHRNRAEASKEEESTGGQKVLLVIIGILATLLVAGLVLLGIKVFVLDRRSGSSVSTVSSQSGQSSQTSGTTASGSADLIENPSEEEIKGATYNLFNSRQASLKGTVSLVEGSKVLTLEDKISVYGAGSGGKSVLLSQVSYVGFNTKNTNVSKEQIEALTEDDSLSVQGNLSIIDNQVYLFPDSLSVSKESQAELQVTTGAAEPTESAAQNGSTENAETTQSSEYVLPQSDSKYLTDEDVQGLTLQQLNYAKNEIFARHGRKFTSQELQNYFNSKSWYKGTVEASQFSDSVFNEYEKANVEFLKEKEFAMDPAGYALDQ